MIKDSAQCTFFLIPEPIQIQILNYLKLRDFDAVAILSKAFLQLRDISRFHKYQFTLQLIQCYRHPQIIDLACRLILKNLRFSNQTNELKAEVISTMQNRDLKLKEFLKLSEVYPSAAQYAKELASSLEDPSEQFGAIIQIMRQLKSINPFNDFKKIELLKDVIDEKKFFLGALKIAEKSGNLTKKEEYRTSLNHLMEKLPHQEKFNIFAELAEFSLEPQRELSRARNIIDFFPNEFKYKSRVTILCNSLHIASSSQNETDKEYFHQDFEKLKAMIIDLKVSRYQVVDSFITDTIQKILKVNSALAIKIAIKLAKKMISRSAKISQLLELVKIAKNKKLLQKIIDLNKKNTKNPEFILFQTIEIALHVFQDLSLAKEIAGQLEFLLRAFPDHALLYKTFIKIYQISKDENDLLKAKQYLTQINQGIPRITAIKSLYKLSKDKNLIEATNEALRSLTQVEDKIIAHIKLSKLNNETSYLYEAKKYIKLLDLKHQDSFLERIFFISLTYFKNYELANECINEMPNSDSKNSHRALLNVEKQAEGDDDDFVYIKSIDPDYFEEAVILLATKWILKKRFEEVYYLYKFFITQHEKVIF